MKLLGRTTRPDDLDQCIALVRDRFLYDEAALADLQKMWQAVLSRDVGRSAVVFEAGDPRRVLAFGVSAAISESRFDAILADGSPFVGQALLEDWRSGKNPFLDEPSFAAANARDGLHVVVMHNGIAETIEARFLPAALALLSENFVVQHRGSNMKAMVHEAFGVPREFPADHGMLFVPYASMHDGRLAELPAERRPMLLSMTREHAERHPGNLVMNQTFLQFTPPQCNLRILERQLLRFALEGIPDDDIAAILRNAPRTLKKRWANVYAAMEPVTAIPSGGDGGHRGAEIRRHVLRYVREHPEELHAYSA